MKYIAKTNLSEYLVVHMVHIVSDKNGVFSDMTIFW